MLKNTSSKFAILAALGVFGSTQAQFIDGTEPGLAIKFNHDFIDIAKDYYLSKTQSWTNKMIDVKRMPSSYHS